MPFRHCREGICNCKVKVKRRKPSRPTKTAPRAAKRRAASRRQSNA